MPHPVLTRETFDQRATVRPREVVQVELGGETGDGNVCGRNAREQGEYLRWGNAHRTDVTEMQMLAELLRQTLVDASGARLFAADPADRAACEADCDAVLRGLPQVLMPLAEVASRLSGLTPDEAAAKNVSRPTRGDESDISSPRPSAVA